MTEHDALCPQRHQYRGHKSRCVCALLAAARADERERWGLGWVAAADNVQALAHAEAVAAKLVEVIVRQEYEADRQGDLIIESQAAIIRRLTNERDAARAEVAALREEVAHAWAVANGEARR